MTDWIVAIVFVVSITFTVVSLVQWMDRTADRRDAHRRNHAHRRRRGDR